MEDRSLSERRRPCARVSGVLFALLLVGWGDARAQSCPTSGHDVTIATACTFNGGSYAFTGTLTISAAVTAASNVGNTAVVLSSDHITVTSTGSINATARGFAAQNGPGHGGTPAGGSGAGHGGVGGGTNGGAAYGSITLPTTLGSGGGYTSGGAGGGAVRLTAAQSLVIHGTITANANNGGYLSGGGAGGSILLEATSIAGTGSLQAFGGTSYLNNYGGGAGGRIALIAQTDTSNLFANALAYGAVGTTNAFGGAGTIYANVGGVTSLRVDNNGQVGGATQSRSSFAIDHLIVSQGALFRVEPGHVVDVNGTITGGGASARIGVAAGGTFNPPSTTTVLNGIGLILDGTWARTTDLTVQSATVVHGGTFSGPLRHLTVGAGATFSRAGLTTFALDSVTVLSGGTLTHQPNTNAETHKLDVAATTIDVRAGGVVSANALGYTAQNGPSSGGTSGAGYGAGHGGLGGNGSAAAYGSVVQPTTLGSGGGYSSGGIGGGAIKLVASGAMTIDGSVTANATSGGYSSGGGAGGSIWLQAATLGGSGALRANGGGSYLNNMGGGAGGRIAIYAGLDTSTLFAATNIQAAGGLNNAGAGTIYGDVGGVTSLRIDNNGVVGGVTPSRGSMVVDHFSVRAGGLFRIDSGHQIEATSSVGGSGASARLWVQSGGAFVAPSAATVLSGLNVELYGTWARTTDLTVQSGTFVHGGTFSGPLAHLAIGAAGTFSRAGLTTFSLSSVAVLSGGTLTHQANTNAEVHKLDVSAATIDIRTGGAVSVNGVGYAAQNGPGNGTTSGAGFGAGHGGLGGNGGAAAYGSISEPTTLGSGGGYSNGGAGGGAVKLVASGVLTVDGTITTNGLSGGYSAGGGAGGSIWLQAATLVGGGTLRANGGGSYLNNMGGGAGGRIALVAASDASSLLVGTNVQAAGGPLNAGAGTIYSDLGGVRMLRVDNNGSVGGATPSRGSAVVDHLSVRSGGLLRIDNGHALEVTGSIGGSGASARLVVQSGATLVAPATTTVISGLNVELYGTWGRTTDLTVQSGAFVHGGVFSGPLVNLVVDAAGTFSRAGLSTFELGTVTVRSGGTLTHQPNGATESHKLDVAADRIEVQAGGVVSANTMGFAAQVGPGNGTTSGAGFGAGHGGFGGASGGGAAYGSVSAPVTLGSGGGYSNGGVGGGAVKLIASQTLIVDGSVTAHGGNGGYSAGGGAGGSIWLGAQTLSGNGTVRANGGNSYLNTLGGGAGGRIALIATQDTSTLLVGTNVQAAGGLATGGAGTVFSRIGGVDALRVDNLGTVGARTPLSASATYRTLGVRGGALLLLPSGVTVTVQSGVAGNPTTGTQGTLRVDSGATLALPLVTELDRLDLNVAGALAGVSDFRVTNGTWTYAPQVAHQFGAVTLGVNSVVEYGGTQRLAIIGKLDLQGNAILRHQPTVVTQGTAPGAQHVLDITCSEANIGLLAMIDLNGRGYNRGAGPGRGTTGTTAGGGGYGGAGGQSSAAISGGAPYGSASLPDDVGSGGGDDSNSSTNTNGAGGGLLKLAVCGTLTVDGIIRANGEVGEVQEGGGGSGGGIRIDAGVLVGVGSIQANGGTGGANSTNGGGGGGGGRIALSYGTKLFIGGVVANGAARGGTGAATAGAHGSVEQAERQDAVCENPPCGIGLCAGSWDAALGACDYGPSNGTTCSDGNACTTGDACASGTCVGGGAVVCNDGNACTNDACDAQLGCRFTPRSGACDDGNACTQNTICINAVCAGGTATSCDDGNQCTAETCDPVTGCASTPLSNTTCSDGDPCTTNDLCATGTCVGVPLKVLGCFGAFPGAPVIGPAIPTLVSRDGGAVSIDLSDHENDYEDGPGGDHNLLFWSIEDTQPWLYEVDFDPATEVLTLTPHDPAQPFSTVLTVTLVDSDGLTDTQLVVYEHTLSRWVLALAAAPAELRIGQATTLTATLSSPMGRPLGNRAVTLALTGAPRGYLASAVAVTDSAGLATFTFHATEHGTQAFSATHADGRDTATADTSVQVVPAANDVAVFTLDLAFFDPLTGFEVFPGDLDPIAPGAPLELRARVRNLGTQPTPPLTVAFTDRRVTFSPPSVSDEVLLATLTTPPLAPQTDVVLSHTTAFADVGFHLFGVVVDPDDDLVEDDEDNNRAAQGFWIGPTGGGMDVISASCELRGAFTEGGVTAVHVDGALELTGRADYAPFLPFDPDGSRGIAGVRGGRVSLRLFDAQGNEVSYAAGATAMFPAAGNATTHRALYTIGQWDAPDQSPVGRFPNRSADDAWAFPPPQTLGCYTLRACVDDASFEGCCEQTFCVVPRGADLTCDAPTLPEIGGLESAPEVGVPTTVSAPIQNKGDVTVGPVFARLVVDGVPVAVAELGAMGPFETKVASFAWTPTCGANEVAVEVDFDDLIEERRESDNRCARTTKDLALDRIVALPATGCAMDFGLVQIGAGSLPSPAVSGTITVTSPSGAAQEAATTTGRGTLVGGPFTFAEAGVYTVVGKLDTPFGADRCGVAPESDEVANNTVTLTVCPDPSPWRDRQGANHRGTIDVALSSTLRYGTSTTVTATITNHGLVPLSGPIDVLLTTPRGPILATDADATGDRKTLALSCADPLMPGASKDVSWQWTPRHRDDDLGPEVRELWVVVDPEQTLASCAPANDATSRAFSMNLFAGISGSSVGLGAATFTTLVGNNGGIIPNGEGAVARFALRRASGVSVHTQTADIVSPAPNAPERSSFTVDLAAVDCDPTDPLVRAELFADATDVYSEFNETDNVASVSLPNLVPVRITQVADGCQSRFAVEVENIAPEPHLPVGTWYAQVTLTPPSGAPSTSLVGPFTGTGTFEILSNIETTAAGPYTVDVTIDGRDTTACGDLFESNERDNGLSRTFTLCADPSAEVAGADLQVVGPVRWGTPFTVIGHVRNVGGIALTGDLTARLALADRPLSTVDAAEKTLGFDCQAPLRPGETRTFTWEVTLHESDGVSALVMTLDPAGARDECSESNNVASRGLWLDLSPWLDYRGSNFGAAIDITADQVSSMPTQAGYSIFVRPPHPNSDEPPIVIGPRGDEGAFSRHTWVKRSGDRVLIGTSPIGTPIAGTPSEILFTAAPLACDLFDPPSHLEVLVDAGERLAENDESNNTTTRPFPNLAPGLIKRTDVQQSRTSIDVPVSQLVNKALPHPAFHVAGTLTSPSGIVTPLSAGPVTTSPVRLGSHVLVRENGLYHVLAEVDAPTQAAPCGLVAEQDEVDNVATASFFLCPDVKVSSRFLAPPAFGVPTPIEVELENVGNTTLIEDVALTVKGFTHEGVEVPLTLSPAMPVISAAPGNGVDPEHTRTTVFSWTPSAATATVVRFEIDARIVDTVPDNGAYADAECRTDNNKTSLTTTLDQGCVVQADFGTWTACSQSDLTIVLTRPDSGAPIDAGASVTAALTPLSNEWPASAQPVPVVAEGAGVYRASLTLPPAATWSAVRGAVTVTTADGATCQVQADTVIQPGVPDLSVHSADIRFVAKNGDPTAFNRAAVGDRLDLQVMVSNHVGACQARNVIGTLAIELGFGQITLGSWSIPRLDPGTSTAVTLTPNTLLANPPTLVGDFIRWVVTAPSPWLHVFKAQITGATVLDVKRTDNGASRSLLIGNLGAQADLTVSIVAPTTGAPLIAHTRATTTLRVSDLEGDPVAPSALARFSLFALDGQGGGFSGDPAIDDAIDVLAFGTYLGDGLYETELDIALPATRTLELVAMAARVDGPSGADEARYPIIDVDPDCPCDDGNACTIDRCDEDGACIYLPLPPRPIPDATCDGIDDDCDGLTDEDFVGTTKVCGDNACATPTTTQCVDGEVVSDCDPIWAAITELGDDVCTPDVPEQVAYAIAYSNGQPIGTIRCYNRAGDPTPVRCDTEADGKTLVVYDGLYCPVAR